MNSSSAVPDVSGINLYITGIIFTMLQVLVMLMAVFGNFLVIVVFVKYMNCRATHKFIINLAVADLLTGLAMIFQITVYFVPEITSHMVGCLFQFQTISVFTLSSQLSVIFCTVDRFIAIGYPLKHAAIMTSSNTAILLAVPWVFALSVGILPFAGLNNWTGEACVFGLVVSRAELILVASATWIQALACLVMYCTIFRVACKRKRKISQLGLSKRREIKSGVMMAIVTVIFTTCWIPFSVTTFIQTISFNTTVAFVGNCLVFVGVAHSIINPLIYSWQKADFRRFCRRLLCGRPSAPLPSRKSPVRTISAQIEVLADDRSSMQNQTTEA